MDDLIAQLGDLNCHLNPPCTLEQLRFIPAALACDLDSAVLALYTNHNGMTESGTFPFRLMPIDEVATTYHSFQDVDFPTHAFRAFWTDDNSNYAGYYTEGPLRGKICLIDHEEPDLAPRYRSLRSFYATALEAATVSQPWYKMPTDYPIVAALHAAHDDGDTLLAFQYITAYQTSDNVDQRLYFACCAMNLLPLSETDQLFPFAHDEDMWIQERACELLGLRRVASAVPALADIVRTGTPNGQTAALGALGKIGTDEAQKQLLSLARETIPGLKLYVAAALQACGYEVKRAGEQWQYRAPQSERWQLL